jgi:nucleoside-diphosphate-sugar epimerase
VGDVDFVLHHAALSSVAGSLWGPIAFNEVNVTGTLNLLVAARDAGVKRFIYAACSSAYGDTPILFKREDMIPRPLSPYALTKLIGEHYCRIFYHLYGLETVSLRYFNVFGPRQNPASEYSAVIPKFISAILKGEPITIYGDGEQTRDFVYVQDVVKANLLSCEASDVAGEVINIASGKESSLNQLILAIEGECDIKAHRVYVQPRTGDIICSCADITKAKDLLGYEPTVTFDEGLRKTVEWFDAQLSERKKRKRIKE